MRFLLLDTHLLIWAAEYPERLSAKARSHIADPRNSLLFSAASICELSIKQSLGRSDFNEDARALRRELLENDFDELAVTSAHGVAVIDLPPIHRDPFDRVLVAQAIVEGLVLLTADAVLARYAGPVWKV